MVEMARIERACEVFGVENLYRLTRNEFEKCLIDLARVYQTSHALARNYHTGDPLTEQLRADGLTGLRQSAYP